MPDNLPDLDWIDNIGTDATPTDYDTDLSAPDIFGRSCGPELNLTLGPPGSGKTTRATKLVSREIRRGTPPEQIAFVSFTRGACTEGKKAVVRNCGVPQSKLVHFRTIHSTAYRKMGAPQPIMDGKWLLRFCGETGYKLDSRSGYCTGDFSLNTSSATDGDNSLLAVHEWSRSQLLNLDDGHAKCPVRVSKQQLLDFHEALENFKNKYDLVDYSDMLEFCVRMQIQVRDVSIAFVDEAQDLSPLQAAAVEYFFNSCERVFVFGDDDQSLYGWAGGSPDWLLSLAKRTSHIVTLKYSWRLPKNIHAFSQRIITLNRNRLPKSFRPRRGSPGTLVKMSKHQALEETVRSSGSVLILARNGVHLLPWTKELTTRAIPFLVEGSAGKGFSEAYEAVDTCSRLSSDMPVSVEGLLTVLSFVPSRKSKLVPHGSKTLAKKRLEKWVKGVDGSWHVPALTSDDLWDLSLGKLLSYLDRKDPLDVLLRLPSSLRRYFKHLLEKNRGLLPKPRISLSTIHGSKGRESDTVIIVPDMSKASWTEYVKSGPDGREAERRVAYVGSTRARKNLIIVDFNGKKHFPFHDFF